MPDFDLEKIMEMAQNAQSENERRYGRESFGNCRNCETDSDLDHYPEAIATQPPSDHDDGRDDNHQINEAAS